MVSTRCLVDHKSRPFREDFSHEQTKICVTTIPFIENVYTISEGLWGGPPRAIGVSS